MTDAYAQWKGWQASDFGRCSDNDARYFGWHLRRALGTRGERTLDSSAAPLSVLEIGYGNGRFMGWLRQLGHRVAGVEANAQLVEVARAAGFVAAADLSEIDAGSRFDLIAAFDVLEHVPVAELQGFVESMKMRLAPQGRLLLRFPNGESPFGLWMQHGDLTHVHALGLSKVRQLCTACGLRLEHSGENLPWQAQLPQRRLGAWMAQTARRAFEWRLRKMYSLPRGLDLSPNLLVVLAPE